MTYSMTFRWHRNAFGVCFTDRELPAIEGWYAHMMSLHQWRFDRAMQGGIL